MTRRDRLREQFTEEVLSAEPMPWIGKVVGEENGEYYVLVNGRPVPRKGVSSNEFAFATQGSGSRVGEYVILIASNTTDLATIVGSSPYAI